MYPEVGETWIDPETNKKYEGIGVPIYRWRRAYQNDFQARMDWCVQSYENANHNPVAAFAGDTSDGFIYLTCRENQSHTLDASNSFDPDSDSLLFRWFVYPEPVDSDMHIKIEDSEKSKSKVYIPSNSLGKQVHIVLEVCDNNPIIRLYDYRRVIINIIE